MAKTVVGLFDNFSDAQSVVRDLESAGFRRDDISIARGNAGGGGTTSTTASGKDTGEAAANGAGAGAVVGTVAGLAALAIPGVGPILGMGPLLSGLTAAGIGAGVGAAAGGLVGALTTAGVPEEDARYYNEGVKRGGTLVTVRADDARATEAIAIFNRHNPVDIDTRGAEWSKSGFTSTATAQATAPAAAANLTASAGTAHTAHTTHQQHTAQPQTNVQGEQKLQVVEEELQVGKREVQRGGIRVYSRVEETPVQESVTLREEHVKIERRPVDRPATEADFNTFKEGTIEVTERAEVPVVSKEARVVEEVVVGKEATERTETIRDTVRRTDIEVEKVGAGSTAAAGSSDFDVYESDFRQNFTTTYKGGDYTYDQAKPAYQYGYELARSGKGDWTAVESDARSRWEQRNPGTWDKVKNAARYAYDRARQKLNS